jgi:hypothetical protein
MLPHFRKNFTFLKVPRLRPSVILLTATQMKLSMELCGNDTERVKQKYSKQNLSYCHVVHHESRIGFLGIEPGTLLLKTKN